MSNREIQRLFSLYAELLLLHRTNERLAEWLSGAAYRLPNITEAVAEFPESELVTHFRPDIVRLIKVLKKVGTLPELDELIQLTPPGLFEMMRIKGLGGKKLSVLWNTAKIDTLESLLEGAKNGSISKIPGFGAKTQANIIAAINTYQSGKDRFHFTDVADTAEELVDSLQKLFKTTLVSICGEVRRQTTTVAAIEMVAAITAKK